MAKNRYALAFDLDIELPPEMAETASLLSEAFTELYRGLEIHCRFDRADRQTLVCVLARGLEVAVRNIRVEDGGDAVARESEDGKEAE